MRNSQMLVEMIVNRRKALNLSQRALARNAGLSSAYMCRIEGGEEIDITRPTFTKIFDALKVPPAVSRHIFDGEVSDCAQLLEDGSLEDGGLVYSVEGGTILPEGSRTDGVRVFLPGDRELEPPDGLEIAARDFLGPNGEIPPGARLFDDGTIRMPGEPRDAVTWAEADLLGRFRRVPIEDRLQVHRVLMKVIEAYVPNTLSDAEREAYLIRRYAAQVGLSEEDVQKYDSPPYVPDKPAKKAKASKAKKKRTEKSPRRS